MLTLYALGATPEQMEKHYENNKSYQRPQQPSDEKVLQDLHKPGMFRQYLGKQQYYHDFLVYFQGEIDTKGYQDVINEYLFQGDELAEDMLVRMFGGQLSLHMICFSKFEAKFCRVLAPTHSPRLRR